METEARQSRWCCEDDKTVTWWGEGTGPKSGLQGSEGVGSLPQEVSLVNTECLKETSPGRALHLKSFAESRGRERPSGWEAPRAHDKLGAGLVGPPKS